MKPMHIVMLALGILSGCKKPQAAEKSEPRKTIRFEDAHSSALGEAGWISTFLSREGKFEGMDSDSEISFSDGGKVWMTEYGVAPIEYSGTFTVDDRGEITANFENYPGQWPKMVLRKVGGRILLFRADAASGLEFGGRGGALETPEMKPFWPFGLSELSWERPEQEIEETGDHENPGNEE